MRKLFSCVLHYLSKKHDVMFKGLARGRQESAEMAVNVIGLSLLEFFVAK